MCSTTDLLNEFAEHQQLSSQLPLWMKASAAARFFYCPGNSQPCQRTRAAASLIEVRKALKTSASKPPHWLEKAVACAA
jgi:hypothetical protein